ncbi:hypothetical protein MASR1M32_17600 [Rhodobacter sp.]
MAEKQGDRAGDPRLGQFGARHLDRADGIILHPGCAGDFGQGCKGIFRRSVFGHQPVEGDGPDPAGTDEAKPVKAVILRSGWCGVCGVRKEAVRHAQPRLIRESHRGPRTVNEP